MLKDTPSINKPRFFMATKVCQDLKATIDALAIYRSGWENDIREGWNCNNSSAKDILYELYEISGTIILALQNVIDGKYRGKTAMILTQKKLQRLIKSKSFRYFDEMGVIGAYSVVTSGTKHHIRVMKECLEMLTA